MHKYGNGCDCVKEFEIAIASLDNAVYLGIAFRNLLDCCESTDNAFGNIGNRGFLAGIHGQDEFAIDDGKGHLLVL